MKIKKILFTLLIAVSFSAYCFLNHQQVISSDGASSTETELIQLDEQQNSDSNFQPEVHFVKKAVYFLLKTLPAS